MTYRKTTLLTERNNAATTGLDGLGVRAAEAGFPSVAEADPPVPIVSSHDPRLTLDVEGLVASPDGTYVPHKTAAILENHTHTRDTQVLDQ